MVVDPNLFRIMAILGQYGRDDLPFKIIKEKQSYIVGDERETSYLDGRGGHRKVFEEACKVTFIKSTGDWKLYWKRASGKWDSYGVYDSLDTAMREVKKDPNGCFWG